MHELSKDHSQQIRLMVERSGGFAELRKWCENVIEDAKISLLEENDELVRGRAKGVKFVLDYIDSLLE